MPLVSPSETIDGMPAGRQGNKWIRLRVPVHELQKYRIEGGFNLDHKS